MPNLWWFWMEPRDSREVGSHRGVDRRRPPRPRNPAQLSQTAVVLPRLRRQWASRRVVQWQNGVLITRKSEVRSLPLRPALTREARASALVRLITGQPGGSIRSRHQPTGIADPQRRGFRDAPGQRPPVLPLPPRFPVALSHVGVNLVVNVCQDSQRGQGIRSKPGLCGFNSYSWHQFASIVQRKGLRFPF
jgi:hypothetical protein